jgi:hypothetical protein
LVARIGGGRFVDPLTLGDLAALAVDRRRHRLVARLDQQRRQVFRARSARLPGWPFSNRVRTDGLPRLAVSSGLFSDMGLPYTSPMMDCQFGKS